MARARVCLIAVVSAVILLSCSDRTVPPDNAVYEATILTESQLVAANNAFAFSLFKEITQTQPESNIAICPISAAMSLGMAMNGAAGPTQDAIQSTLGLSGYTLDSANECFRDLISVLRNLDPAVQIEIGNSVWSKEGVDFEEGFLRACEHCFDADLMTLDFGRPDAVDIMNSWVEQKTYGRITEIVEKPVDPLVTFFLINAVYFKGGWMHKFDPTWTTDDWFILPDGSKTRCKMMAQYRSADDPVYVCCETPRFYAIDMAYGDSLFSMTVVLPKVGVPVDSVVYSLNDQDWNEWTGGLHNWRGVVYFPRFHIEYGLRMNDVLSALGMAIAFDDSAADFSNMCARGDEWYIYRVMHKTYIKVDEKGTEAAGATDTEGGPTGIPPVLKINRPFLFFIREHRTNTIAFMGKVVDPGLE